MDGALPTHPLRWLWSLRAKVLLVTMLLLAASILLIYTVERTILIRSFADLEERQVRRATQRVVNALEADIDSLGRVAGYVAQDDALYAFAAGDNPDYPAQHLTESAFQHLDLNFVHIVDSDGKVLHTSIFDISSPLIPGEPDGVLAVPPVIVEQYLERAGIRLRSEAVDTYQDAVQAIPESALIVAIRAIQPTAGGVSNGTIVLGRSLDDDLMSQLSAMTYVSFEVQMLDAACTRAGCDEARAALVEGQDIVVQEVDRDTIAGYTLIHDITGDPALVLRIEAPRDLYHEGQDVLRILMLLMAVVGLGVLIAAPLLLDQVLLRRLWGINRAVQRIGDTGDARQRVAVRGTDELALLAANINHMLDRIDESRRALAASRANLNRVMTAISDVVYHAEIAPDGTPLSHTHHSTRLGDMTGHPHENFAADWHFWQTLIHPDDRPDATRISAEIIDQGHSEVEYRVTCADGRVIWVRDSRRFERQPGRDTVLLHGVISDITARKEAETALAHERNLLRTLVDVIPDAIYAKDRNGRLLLSNQANTRALGHTESASVIGKTDFDCYPQELAEQYWADDMQVIQTGEPLLDREERRFRDAKGTPHQDVHWVLTTKVPLRSDAGQVVGLVGIGRDITDRQAIQRQLRDSEERYRVLFEQANDGIFLMQGEFVLDCNAEVERMFGAARDQIIGARPDEYSPPRQPDGRTSRDAARAYIEAALAGTPQTFDWVHRRADGSLFNGEVTLSRLDLSEQALLMVFVRDVTARKEAEARLAASEQRFRRLFEAMPSGCALHELVLDEAGEPVDYRITNANPAYGAHTGLDPAQVVGQLASEAYDTEEPPYLAEYSRAALGGETQQFEAHFAPMGRDFSISVFSPGENQFATIFDDISERVRSREALHRAHDELERRVLDRTADLTAERNLLRTLIDHIPDVIFIKDSFGHFVTVNEHLVALLGAGSEDEVIGKSDTDFFPEELAARYRADEEAVLASGQPLLYYEEPTVTARGGQRWMLTSKLPLRDAGGNIVRIIGIGRDITAQKRAHEELEQRVAERTAALSEANATLRASQARFQSAFRYAAVGMALLNFKGEFVKVNRAFAEMLHYAIDELEGRTFAELTHPDDVGGNVALLHQAALGEIDHGRLEKRFVRRDGQTVEAVISFAVVRDDVDRPSYVVSHIQDVTETRQAQRERERLLNKLAGRAAELAAVAEISRRVSTILDLGAVLRMLARLTRDQFDLYQVEVYLLEDDNRLRMVAADGAAGQVLMDSAVSLAVDASHSLIAESARTRQFILANDITQVESFIPNPLLPETRAQLVLPLVVGYELVGVLSAEDDAKDRFDADAVNILTTLAAQLAIAVHHARLFTDNARRLAIIEAMHDLVGLAPFASEAEISYLNPAGLRMVGCASLEEAQAQQMRSFYPPDMIEIFQQEVLPVVREQGSWRGESRLLGPDGSEIPVEQSVFVIHDERGEPRDLATIATDITRRKRNEAALHRLNRAYRILSDGNQALVRIDDEQELLEAICDVVVEHGGYDLAWVGYLADADPDHPDNAGEVGADDAPPVLHPRALASRRLSRAVLDALAAHGALAHPPLDGPTGAALRAREPVVVHAVQDNATYQPWRVTLQRLGHQSLLGLPLRVDDSLTGLLIVCAAQQDVFTDEEVSLLVELVGDLAYGLRALALRREREAAEDRLRRSQANLVAQIENSEDLIWSVDAEGRLITHNSQYLASFQQQYGVAIQRGMVPTDYQTPERRADWLALYERAREGQRFTVERHLQLQGENRAIDVEISLNPILAEDGSFNGISIFSRDITQAKQDDLALRKLNQRLSKRNRELLTLHEVGHKLSATLELDAIYRVLYTDVVRGLLGTDNLIIALYDEAEQIIQPTFVVVHDAEVPESDLPPMPLGQGPNSQTIRTRQPRIENMSRVRADLAARDRLVEVGSGPESRSAVYVPMISQDRVIGVVNIQHATADVFGEEDVKLLSIIANQAATAIENARLFAAEREHRLLAEALRDTAAVVTRLLDLPTMMTQILESIAGVLPYDTGNIMLLAPDDRLSVVAHRGYEARDLVEWIASWERPLHEMPISQRIRQTRQAGVVPDTRTAPEWIGDSQPESTWIQSSLKAPLVIDDMMVGIIHLDSATPLTFSETDVPKLQAFADQAAAVLHNVRLFEAERAQRALAEALRDTAAVLNSSLNFDTVLERILANVQAVLPHDVTSIMFIGPDEDTYVIGHRGYAERGLAAWIESLRLPVASTPDFAAVYASGQPYVVPDTASAAEWVSLPETAWIRSHVTLPITRDEAVIGFLLLDSATPGHFRPEQLGQMRAFADQAGVALRNAELFASEHDSRLLAEALSDNAATINRTLALDVVLERILENVRRVFEHDAANIMLIEDGVARVAHAYGYAERGLGEFIANLSFEVTAVPSWQLMLATGEPIVIPDTAQNEAWGAVVSDPEAWIGSTVKAPILLDDNLIGVLHLDSATPHTFDTTHAGRLKAFAEQAAIAIRNAQLFEQTQTHAATLAQAVRERTAELEAQREQLGAILDNMGEGLIYGAAGEVVYFNRAFTTMFGYDEDELREHPMDLFEQVQRAIGNSEQFLNGIREHLDREGTWTGETTLVRHDGTTFQAALIVTRVPTLEPGRPDGLVTIIRDISQEHELQVQRERFIANASHELRTPLANVKTRLYLLRNQPDRFEQHMAILDRVTDTMTDLVQNLLDISRFERGVIELHAVPVAWQDLIRDVVSVQMVEADQRAIELRADLADDPLPILADPPRFSQVITNLVVNALNYTPPGGQVIVTLARAADDPQAAVMRVQDSGVGISADALPHIFTPFFRADQGTTSGTGLGLTIAREIVHLHGGQIGVESEEGVGSVFSVRLALRDDASLPDE